MAFHDNRHLEREGRKPAYSNDRFLPDDIPALYVDYGHRSASSSSKATELSAHRSTTSLITQSNLHKQGTEPDSVIVSVPSFGHRNSQKDLATKQANRLIESFITRKKHLLFKDDAVNVGGYRSDCQFTEDDFMPAVEAFMDFPSTRHLRERFFDEVEIGDIVCCSVTGVTDSGLSLLLLCYGCGRNRDLEPLKIHGFCSIRDIPELLSDRNQEVADVYSVKDRVNGVIVSVSPSSERLQISLLERDVPRAYNADMKLGLIRFEDMPPSYRTLYNSDDLTYSQLLHANVMFYSSDSTSRMCQQLKLSTDPRTSLLHKVSSLRIPHDQMASSLRKQQSRVQALQFVVKGVKLYKEGNQNEALSMYNKAIDIDTSNVEALVARGALYANNESYVKASEDFMKALEINPKHQNALDYLLQTLFAYGRDLEDEDNKEAAIRCYKHILSADPTNAEADNLLSNLLRDINAEQEAVVSSTRADSTSPQSCRNWKNRPQKISSVEKATPSSSRQRLSSQLNDSSSPDRSRHAFPTDKPSSRLCHEGDHADEDEPYPYEHSRKKSRDRHDSGRSVHKDSSSLTTSKRKRSRSRSESRSVSSKRKRYKESISSTPLNSKDKKNSDGHEGSKRRKCTADDSFERCNTDRPPVDMFSSKENGVVENQKKHKAISSTSFLPYCLATDPTLVRKAERTKSKEQERKPDPGTDSKSNASRKTSFHGKDQRERSRDKQSDSHPLEREHGHKHSSKTSQQSHVGDRYSRSPSNSDSRSPKSYSKPEHRSRSKTRRFRSKSRSSSRHRKSRRDSKRSSNASNKETVSKKRRSRSKNRKKGPSRGRSSSSSLSEKSYDYHHKKNPLGAHQTSGKQQKSNNKSSLLEDTVKLNQPNVHGDAKPSNQVLGKLAPANISRSTSKINTTTSDPDKEKVQATMITKMQKSDQSKIGEIKAPAGEKKLKEMEDFFEMLKKNKKSK